MRKVTVFAFIYIIIFLTNGQSGEIFTSPSRVMFLKTGYLSLNERGTVLFSSGLEYRPGWEAPLSGYSGDLARLGLLHISYYVSGYVSIQIRGAVKQILHIDPFYSAVENRAIKSTDDVGDFRVATLANLFPANGWRPALGLRIETKLPNTNQKNGLGTNSTDISLAVLATHSFSGFMFFSDIGVGILSSPVNVNEQNDVLEYGLGFIWAVHPSLKLAGEVNGFLSTRKYIPPGTEDRGILQLGIIGILGDFAFEFFPGYGLNNREGGFGISTGISWQMDLFPERKSFSDLDY